MDKEYVDFIDKLILNEYNMFEYEFEEIPLLNTFNIEKKQDIIKIHLYSSYDNILFKTIYKPIDIHDFFKL